MRALRKLGQLLTWRGLSVLGVASAAVTVASVNLLAARHPSRFDWTKEGLYTLSPATVGTLQGLLDPVEVVVFLGKGDPLRPSVEQLLDGYVAQTRLVNARYVDPDRDPGELLALQAKYSIETGRAEDGRVATDAVIVVAKGEKRWYITHDDIVTYDETSGEATPKLERALTVALRQVEHAEPVSVCFTTGHEEISIEDVSPTGLAEIARRLEKDNYAVSEVALSPSKRSDLSSCAIVVVAAPDVPFENTAAEAVVARFNEGGRILVLAGTGLGESLRVEDRGLGRITRVAGIALEDAVVLEQSPEARLPEGVGETFFATPVDHAATTALFRRGRPELFALVTLAQPLRAIDGRVVPRALLESSSDAVTVASLRGIIDGTGIPATAPNPDTTTRRQILAMAAELPPLNAVAKAKSGSRSTGPSDDEPPSGALRRMVVAPASVAFARNWRDPSLRGTQLFFEGVFSWLSARPMLVDVPTKQARPVGLALTEAELGEVWRYVLIYMPFAAIALAALVLRRRRTSSERQAARHAGAGEGRTSTRDPTAPDDATAGSSRNDAGGSK